MLTRRLFLLAALTALLVLPESARSEDDYVFAGTSLDLLNEGINVKKVPLENTELKAEIRANRLAVLLVPGTLPDPPAVRKCYRGVTTSLISHKVSHADIVGLQKFAKDVLPTLVSEIMVHWFDGDRRERAIETLKSALEKRPAQERAADERLAGAMLAGLEPTDKNLASLVAKYRDFVEEEVKEALGKPEVSTSIKGDLPYTFGGRSLTSFDLRRLRPDTFKPLVVKGKEYHKAWVGKTLVITTSPPLHWFLGAGEGGIKGGDTAHLAGWDIMLPQLPP